MSSMTEVYAHGFRVGYHEFKPNRSFLPNPPYMLRDPNRYLWIDGWRAGMTLAAKHWAEAEHILSTLVPEQEKTS